MATPTTNPYCAESENTANRVCELCPEEKVTPKGSLTHVFFVKNGAVVPSTDNEIRIDNAANFASDMLEMEKAGLATIIRCTKGSTSVESTTGEGRCRVAEEVKTRVHTLAIQDYDAFANMHCTNDNWTKLEKTASNYHVYYGSDIAGFKADGVSLSIDPSLSITEGLEDDLIGDISVKWTKKERPCVFVYNWEDFKDCPQCLFVTATAGGSETIAQPTANPLVIDIAAAAAMDTALEFDCDCITTMYEDPTCRLPAWVTLAATNNPLLCDSVDVWSISGTSPTAACEKFRIFVTGCNGFKGSLDVTIKTT